MENDNKLETDTEVNRKVKASILQSSCENYRETEKGLSERRKVISTLNSFLWNKYTVKKINTLVFKSFSPSVTFNWTEIWTLVRRKANKLLTIGGE